MPVTVLDYDSLHIVPIKKFDTVMNRKRKVKSAEVFVNAGSGFDSESSVIDQEQKYSYSYLWQFSIGDNDDQYVFYGRYTKTCIQFLNQLSCVLPKNATLIVFVANLNYDFSFYKEAFRPYITDIKAKSRRDIITFTLCNNLKFIEAIGVWGNSLEDIANRHTKTKKLVGDLDYTLVRNSLTPLTEQEMNYCINDVLILLELGLKAHEKYTLNQLNIPYTKTGVIRQEVIKACGGLKNNYRDQNKVLCNDQEQYKFLRRYMYCGGWCHTNFKYKNKILNDITCYDITSAYPWALNNCKFPCGQLVHVDINNDDEVQEFFKSKHKIYFYQFCGVEARTTHTLISDKKLVGESIDKVSKDGRLLKAGVINIILNEVDMQNFNDMYTWEDTYEDNITMPIDLWYFTDSRKCPNFILEPMNNYYKIKSQIKRRGKYKNPTDPEYYTYHEIKELINSVYGMLCTQLFDKKLDWVNNQLVESEVAWDDVDKTVFNCFIGYWCTSYVRRRLVDIIKKYPDFIVQYDTDSLYCIKNNNLIDYIDDINIRQTATNKLLFNYDDDMIDLGVWSIDGHYDKFLGLGAKRYIALQGDKYCITYAGIPEADIIEGARKQGVTPFEYVKHIDILSDDSTKNCVCYKDKDDTKTFEVVDYLGNKQTVTVECCATIYKASFNVKIIENIIELNREALE